MPQADGAERHEQCQGCQRTAPKGTDRAKGDGGQRREIRTAPKDINRT